MRLGLETFSYHLAFHFGAMDIFRFMQLTGELALDGVQININEGGGLHLGGEDPGRLRDVRAMAAELGLFVEVDSRGTDPEHLTRKLHLCRALGADVLRTYVSVGGDLGRELARAPEDLRRVLPLCADFGVRIAVENHEYETSSDLLEIVRRVDSPHVGLLVDTGNSMMVWEDPVGAVRAMAPHAVSSHFKDHVVIEEAGRPLIVGVPIGRGSIDCAECFRILSQESPLQRINIEVCYGYSAPFRRPEAQGAGGRLGAGAFRVAGGEPDPACILPHPLRAAGIEREQLLEWESRAVQQSVATVKQLNSRFG